MVLATAHLRRSSFARIARVSILVGLVASIGSARAEADAAAKEPLSLIASNVSNAAIAPLVPVCSRVAGVEVSARYANNPAVASEIGQGAQFDIVVLESHMLDDLASRALVERSSVRPLAALRMGIATREPGQPRRTSAVAAFKRELLASRSIGYAGDGHSGEVFLKIVDRLKLRDALDAKLRSFTGGYPGAVKASEQVQLVVAPFFNPLPSPLRLVGYFPASLGADVAVSAGASPRARPGTTAFIACLRSPAARAIFTAKGYRVDR